ncbi:MULTISPECIES: hypothetical protein [unclassified Variovorax]|uniref:hypothetical protein n=1 Tax=unclassified Variovorax TaxID=663243 RepID=UPI0008C0DA36|nr:MULTISPECIES: hypothetical protein [unclassified Variovorax]SEK17152.1 hypothetical protein SAMN05518853_13644 [Variovorax sp. OK202]SFE73640.1 hypothetical protein SAMN05444746_13544 [Variovorax sp. OK212]
MNTAPDPDLFQRGYRAGDKATVDLSDEENETLLRAFKAGFVHRRAERTALATGSLSPAYMGQDAAHRARLNADDFTPYVSIAAIRDWAEVLCGRPVATSHPPHIGQAARDVWNTGKV